MITVTQLAAWLTGLGIETPVQPSFFLAPVPVRSVFVTLAGGQGTLNEREMDRVTFAALCRGLSHQYSDAEALAAQVDDAVLSVFCPTQIGGSFVNDIDRVGAPPRFQSWDKGGSTIFICTYQITHAR